MQTERVSDKEAACLLILFIIGSSLIIGLGGDAKNDAWLAAITGLFMALPMLLVYCRLLLICQGSDLFDILRITLGNIAGGIASAMYILYAFHLGALVLRNFGEFINTIAMPETPMLFSMLCMGAVCIVGARLGVEALARTTAFFLPLLLAILLFVQLLSIPQLKLDYIKPILGNGIRPVLAGGFGAFSFPFAEAVLFVGLFTTLKTAKSPYRVFFWGFLIASVIIIIVTIRNIAVLGNMLGDFYFPSYAAVSMINIGDFLQRIEVTVSFVFVFGVLIKASICLTVASRGVAKLLRLRDYRSVVIQTGLLMIFFGYIVYVNIMEMRYWAFKVYPYYAFPMQVVIPIIVWIIAEAKARKTQPANANP